MKKTTLILTLLFWVTLTPWLFSQHRYGEVLQKSLFFYEAQQAGKLPDWNRVSWRGDAGLTDGADKNIDLTGGWFDAGDHMKFGFPMAYSVTTLCWGYLENKDAYLQFGQDEIFKNNIRWVTDYLLKCHTAPNELWGQVASGVDHNYWVPAEMVDVRYFREAFKIDASNPGSDLAIETASALAAASIVFADSDPSYSQTLLEHALQLYNFGDTYRGSYHESIPEAASYYKSWSGFQDELVWGAIWLYKATGNQTWLNRATTEYNNLSNESQEQVKSYGWTLAWDDKSYGCYVLMAQLKGDQVYFDDAERHLKEWIASQNPTGKGPNFTPAGMPVLDGWGTNRYAANTAFLMQELSDVITDPAKKAMYYNQAKWLIDYILGDNPQNTSYVIGYGPKSPQNPHHRTAHGSWARSETEPVNTRHTLYGALVGGHSTTSDTDWKDDRSDYIRNEVATDYNSLFTGCVARLAADYGGDIDANFPQPETPDVEFANEVRINSEGSTFTEIAIWSQNMSSFPARIPQLSFQYFVDLTESFAAGYTINDIEITTRSQSQISTSAVLPWDETRNIYYVEITYAPDVLVYPGGQGEFTEETQLRIGLPHDAPASAWDPTNDFSFQEVNTTLKRIPNIPLYGNGELVWGNTPSGGNTPKAVAEASPTSGLAPLTVSFDGSNSSDPNNDALTYTWNFGDNTTGSGALVSHIYGIGNFTATLTVTDPDGNSSSDELSITVSDPDGAPTATATATPESGKIPLVVAFDGSLSTDPDNDPLSYSWTINGSSASNAVSFNHTFNEVGTYTVILTVEANGKSSSTTLSIEAYDSIVPPTVSITQPGNGTTTMLNESLTITAEASDIDGTVSQVEFFAGTTSIGVDISAPFSVAYTPSSLGTVIFTATATDNDGNTQTSDQVSVTVIEENECNYGTPTEYPLPTTGHHQYPYVFINGTGGPTLDNMNNFTINWDLSNNGLWQFSYLTTNGIPDWYIDLRPNLTYTFNQAQPDAILSGTGIPNFDGEYWVAFVEESDFVMVEKSGAYSIYFSLTGTQSSPCLKRALGSLTASSNNKFSVYPNPANTEINISGLEQAKRIALFTLTGQLAFEKLITNETSLQVPVEKYKAGAYIISVTDKNNQQKSELIIIE